MKYFYRRISNIHEFPGKARIRSAFTSMLEKWFAASMSKVANGFLLNQQRKKATFSNLNHVWFASFFKFT